MASRITEDCTVNYNGQLVRLAEGQSVSGNLARFIAATGGPVDPDDDLKQWLETYEEQRAAETEAAAAAVDDEDEDGTVDESDLLELPAGNASTAEWAAYADQEGIDYPDDAGRNDIRAAVEAAQSDED